MMQRDDVYISYPQTKNDGIQMVIFVEEKREEMMVELVGDFLLLIDFFTSLSNHDNFLGVILSCRKYIKLNNRIARAHMRSPINRINTISHEHQSDVF